MPKMTEDERREARRARLGFTGQPSRFAEPGQLARELDVMARELSIFVHGPALFEEEESIGDPPAARAGLNPWHLPWTPEVPERFFRTAPNSKPAH